MTAINNMLTTIITKKYQTSDGVTQTPLVPTQNQAPQHSKVDVLARNDNAIKANKLERLTEQLINCRIEVS